MAEKVITELDDRIEAISPTLRRDRRGRPSGFLDLDDVVDADEQRHRQALAFWGKQGWTDEQARRFCSALSQLEEAWVVFAESGDPDRALWRLVDATGILAEAFPEERREATGRGYRIEKVKPHRDERHRWEG